MAAATTVFCLVFFTASLTNSYSNDMLLMRVVDALENLAQYFQLNFHDFNIDGLFGIRVVEGQIQLILDEHAKYPMLDAVTVDRLRTLKVIASKISEDAIEFVRRDDEKYFEVMNFVIGSPWDILKPHQKIQPQLRWHPDVYIFLKHKGPRIDEQMSDRCMAELTGSLRRDGQGCHISQECLSVMTERGYMGYGITHQILWTMLAEKAGCSQRLNQMLSAAGLGNMKLLQQEFCTNNFFEMQDVTEVMMGGMVLPRYQDLFLEDQFVCPSLGFYEFLKVEYIDQILSWQKELGCYGMMEKPQNQKIKLNSEKNDYIYLDDSPEERAQKVQMKMQKEADKMWGQNVDSNQESVVNMDMQEHNNEFNVNVEQRDVDGSNLLHQHNDRKQHIMNKTNYRDTQLKLNQNTMDRHVDRKRMLSADDIEHVHPVKAGNVVVQKGQNLVAHFEDENIPSGIKRQVDKPVVVHRKLLSLPQKDYRLLHHGGRRLLAEKELKEGCLAHKTAVAAGALMMYLYYLINPGPLNFANSSRPVDPYEIKNMAFFEIDHSEQTFQEDADEKGNFDRLAIHSPIGVHLNNVADEEEEEAYEDEGDATNEEEEDEEDKDDYYEENNRDEDTDRRVVHFGPMGVGRREDENVAYEDEEEEEEDTYADDADEEEEEYENQNEEQEEEEAAYAYYDDNKAKHLDIEGPKILLPVEKLFSKVSPSLPHKVPSQTGQLVTIQKIHLGNLNQRSIFLVFATVFVILLILMYKFIKKRRIHIRYHPRSLLRL